MRPKAYIIGSGPSLLDLTKEEIQHLNHSQYTLSLNCYLEHWEKIGLLPKCHMMADGQFPTIKMLVNDTRLIQKLGDRITYYISHRYLSYFPNWMDISGVKHAFRKRWEIWAQFSYWVPWTISKKNLVPFSQICESNYSHQADEQGWFWAENLSEPLYFNRGTLSSAINLASIIWPNCDIHLLGVDLNTYGYFFDPPEGETQMEKLHKINEKRIGKTSAEHHLKSHKTNTHATAVTYETEDKQKLPGIQQAFPRISEQLNKSDRSLFCSNPNSLLVEQNILPYTPVIPKVGKL
jgi:hypothetical protein